MKKKSIYLLIGVFIFSVFTACENNLQMTLPQGPKGEKGDKGDAGLSAFDLWKEYYGKDPNTSIEEFFNSLKGKDGKDGAVPVIGDNGNWIINGVDTGIPAKGKDGKDGVTPVIGDNGNWFIDGKDTGVPARGQDGFTPYIKDGNWWINDKDTGVPAEGKPGKDGNTPTVEIGPGPDYFWIINNVATTVSAKGIDGKDGEDGKDGYTPVIGDNGNWWIDGKDTGKPSVVIPVIGDNGNWWIGGVDTTKPARGPKGDDGKAGVDGKSAYELWKEAVDLCDGTVKNKDGSAYDCSKNTWEDFLIWLQGGNVSVLHQYWTTLPGNDGKTIQEFIDELFSCHCDGITIIVLAPNDCVTLNSTGAVTGSYNATLKVGGVAGTQVEVSGGGFSGNGTIGTGQTEISFAIPRGDTNKELTIKCTLTNAQQVGKTAIIPALKYIKLGTVSVNPVTGQEKSTAVITFETAPSEVLVNGTSVYNGTSATDGWVVSNGGKTFTKTYDRTATVQAFDVQAKGGNGECSTLNSLFTIPKLTEVTIDGDPIIAQIAGNNCDLSLTLKGTPGMTVKATSSNPALNLTLTESPAGTYSTTELPRRYSAYDVKVTAEKSGSGTYEKTVSVNGVNLSPNPDPLTGHTTKISGVTENASISSVKRRLTNTTDAPLAIKITRNNNSTGSSVRHLSPVYPIEHIIPAGGFYDVEFFRDYTTNYAGGSYTVTITTTNECGLTRDYTLNIGNLTNYRSSFKKPDGFGGNGQPGGPGWDYEANGDPNVTFTVEVFDAIPNSYIEFQLKKGVGYSAVFRAQANSNGYLTQSVTMKASELEAALANSKGYFYFFTDGSYTTKYNIGASKEEVSFGF